MPTVTRQQAEALIIQKAQNDPVFRKELIERPKVVLSREFGLDLMGHHPADDLARAAQREAGLGVGALFVHER